MIKKLGIVGIEFLFSLSASSQSSNFQDALLDELTGIWVLQGTIAGEKTTHDIVTTQSGHSCFQTIWRSVASNTRRSDACYQVI